MSKRTTQWVGGGQLIIPDTQASTAVADVIQMVPPIQIASTLGAQANVVIEAIYLKFSVRRTAIGAMDALGFLVWVSQVQEAGNQPVQVLDALDTSDRVYGNKQILMMGPLSVPAILGASDLASFTTNEEVRTSSHEFQARRKLARQSELLALTVQCDISAITRVFCQWRVLVSY